MAKKITQNINKDAGLLDLPKVNPPRSKWETKHSNYVSCNIGDIYPIYVDEVMPNERRRVTMGMISHMTTPIAPIFNAQYTEFRAFFVPHRLSADLLAGYKTRKSPWVKVFGEDNASSNANIIVPLAQQTLPNLSNQFRTDFINGTKLSFGGIADALDLEPSPDMVSDGVDNVLIPEFNFLNLAAYELIYQKAYRNQNRESATNSDLYKFLFDGYNRSGSVTYNDNFHKAQREKDYFTGSQPFTQKGDPINAPIGDSAPVKVKVSGTSNVSVGTHATVTNTDMVLTSRETGLNAAFDSGLNGQIYADLKSATGVNVETLRLMIKTQELLEKDMMYGSDYASSLNAHFGTAPISLVLDEPLELKKVTITSQMQAIFQTSTTSGEQTILGTIGANATTQSGEFEIVPNTEFKEWGYLIICATHKSQNSYDALMYKPRHIFKKARFDFFTPELDDLGYQSVQRREFNAEAITISSGEDMNSPVSYNEAFAEYRYKFNKVHGMFEPERANALDYWTLSMSNYDDIQSIYKQDVTELNRAISVDSTIAPQFFDAYGFVEINDKPMKLHSIPGFDGVI